MKPNRYDKLVEVDGLDEIVEVQKFNPYHGYHGYFSTANGATSFTFRTKDPNKQYMADMAIARERDRTSGGSGGGGSSASQGSQIKPKQNFVDKFGQESAEAMEKSLSNADPEIKEFWDKYGGKVKIGATDSKRQYCQKVGDEDAEIYIDLDRANNGNNHEEPYQAVFHESAHAIDHMLSDEYNRFSETWNGGEFSKTLKQEADEYIKGFQKKISSERGYKVPIAEARKELSLNMYTWELNEASIVSDVLGGATKGKCQGPFGHGQKYWTGWKDWWGDIRGAHDVSTEAFADFFEASVNPKALNKVKEVFPKSYDCFKRMLKEANAL